MRLDEIIKLPDQDIPYGEVLDKLEVSNPRGTLEQFTVNYAEDRRKCWVILTDSGEMAAFAGFIISDDGWSLQNDSMLTMPKYRGMNLMAKLFKFIKEEWSMSIYSDYRMTQSGYTVWTAGLPKLGLSPMIIDTETEQIIDPKSEYAKSLPLFASSMAPNSDRYIFMMERYDRYPRQNIINEGHSSIPLKGIFEMKYPALGEDVYTTLDHLYRNTGYPSKLLKYIREDQLTSFAKIDTMGHDELLKAVFSNTEYTPTIVEEPIVVMHGNVILDGMRHATHALASDESIKIIHLDDGMNKHDPTKTRKINKFD